jgi:hypothetical protein
MHECSDAYAQVVDQTKRYLKAAAELAGLIDHLNERGEALPAPVPDESGGGWLETGPEVAAAEGRFEWESEDFLMIDAPDDVRKRLAAGIRKAIRRIERGH